VIFVQVMYLRGCITPLAAVSSVGSQSPPCCRGVVQKTIPRSALKAVSSKGQQMPQNVSCTTAWRKPEGLPRRYKARIRNYMCGLVCSQKITLQRPDTDNNKGRTAGQPRTYSRGKTSQRPYVDTSSVSAIERSSGMSPTACKEEAR
jgi:hypothetical protein